MTGRRRATRTPRPAARALRWGALVLGCALLAGLVWAVALRGDTETATDPSAADGTPVGGSSPDTGSTAEPATPARRATSVVSPEAPTGSRLPSGKVVPVRAVDTRPDGLLDVPDDIRLAGWWKGGSKIGDPFGSTLLAAHVDSTTQGLGPYAELLSATAGQRILVSTPSLQQEFEIESLRLVPQGSLADEESISSPDGKRRLTLVTCAPPYVKSEGGYQNLAVVTAIPVDQPTKKTG